MVRFLLTRFTNNFKMYFMHYQKFLFKSENIL